MANGPALMFIDFEVCFWPQTPAMATVARSNPPRVPDPPCVAPRKLLPEAREGPGVVTHLATGHRVQFTRFRIPPPCSAPTVESRSGSGRQVNSRLFPLSPVLPLAPQMKAGQKEHRMSTRNLHQGSTPHETSSRNRRKRTLSPRSYYERRERIHLAGLPSYNGKSPPRVLPGMQSSFVDHRPRARRPSSYITDFMEEGR